MATKDPFAKIATKTGTTKKAASKIAAAVTKKIKDSVDKVIDLKAKIKSLKADQDVAEQLIIDHVRPQQDSQARAGNYSKSFFVEGAKGSLTYTTQDKFTIEKSDDVHEALSEMLGDRFDEYLKYVRTITLKPAVQENATLINKIIKACTTAGISIEDAFEVKDVLVTQKDLDVKQYEMEAAELEEFRTLVRQYKASLK